MSLKPSPPRPFFRVGVPNKPAAPVPAAPPMTLGQAKPTENAEIERFTFFYRGPFSQWSYSPFRVDGVLYQNGEKWMMAEKARLFSDEAVLAKILALSDPQKIKALGRDVAPFEEAVWVANRVRIVREGNRHKFEQNPKLLEMLMASEGTLVEASPYDAIWGIGLGAADPLAQRRETWRGLNLLGDDVLTWLRGEFEREMAPAPTL